MVQSDACVLTLLTSDRCHSVLFVWVAPTGDVRASLLILPGSQAFQVSENAPNPIAFSLISANVRIVFHIM